MSTRQVLSPAAYQVRSERNIMAPMRDGVNLAADIHRPVSQGSAGGGPVPCPSAAHSLQQVHGSQGPGSKLFHQPRLRDRGGKIAAAGTPRKESLPSTSTRALTAAIPLEWLARQPWCNGRVGTFGVSYAAHVQAALACLNPPQLACMWMDSGRLLQCIPERVPQRRRFRDCGRSPGRLTRPWRAHR